MSAKQVEANRRNAKKSTGPRTAMGKDIVAGNGLKHGILSTKLLLEGEDPANYRSLIVDLAAALSPVGALEEALVEKVAIALWRQARLIRAETATLELQRKPDTKESKVAIGEAVGRYDAVNSSDISPPDREQIAWCQNVLDKLGGELNAGSVDQLKVNAPIVWEQTVRDAESEGMGVTEFLASYSDDMTEYGLSASGLAAYLRDLQRWCTKELEEQESREHVQAVVALVQDSRSAPICADLIVRYQTAIDGELYRALKAFREAQEWRLKTIEGQVEPAEASVR